MYTRSTSFFWHYCAKKTPKKKLFEKNTILGNNLLKHPSWPTSLHAFCDTFFKSIKGSGKWNLLKSVTSHTNEANTTKANSAHQQWIPWSNYNTTTNETTTTPKPHEIPNPNLLKTTSSNTTNQTSTPKTNEPTKNYYEHAISTSTETTRKTTYTHHRRFFVQLLEKVVQNI